MHGGNGRSGVYAYDGLGRRIKTTNETGIATTYVYDAVGQLMAEYGATGSAGTSYPMPDQLGTTRVIRMRRERCSNGWIIGFVGCAEPP